MRSPLRGRYLVQNPLWNTWLRGSDAVLDLLRPENDRGVPANPRRLLVAVGGHLGDAVIATSVVAPLRAKWPDLEIGVLTGSWNATVFRGLPEISWLHSADHWKLNRSTRSLMSRASRFAASSRTALQDMIRVGYDVAIDLYPYYPNAGALLRRARIPVRVGYSSGGGGAHFTRRVEWEPGPVANDHRRLLAEVGVEMPTPSYRLPPLDIDAQERVKGELLRDGVDVGRYVVFHMGAGHAIKLWPQQEWTDLARSMSERNCGIVLTGSGLADRELTRAFAARVPSAIDMCDRFDWNGFRAVLGMARAVISVDTVAAHLSAGQGTPTMVVTTGTDLPERWTPIGSSVVAFTEPVPCSPCFRSRGCAHMDCIRLVKADRVAQALAAILQ